MRLVNPVRRLQKKKRKKKKKKKKKKKNKKKNNKKKKKKISLTYSHLFEYISRSFFQLPTVVRNVCVG